MENVAVNLQSLRRLIEECLDNDARCRAELMAISKGKSQGKLVPFSALVSRVLAEARRLSQPRYQDLLDAIAHDPGAVSDALDRFVAGPRGSNS